jgi:putative oxidoreductase
MTYFVSGVEFVGGSLLTVGGPSPLNWLDDFLYVPEVLYVLFFILLICFGPGKFSVDRWLAGKLRG